MRAWCVRMRGVRMCILRAYDMIAITSILHPDIRSSYWCGDMFERYDARVASYRNVCEPGDVLILVYLPELLTIVSLHEWIWTFPSPDWPAQNYNLCLLFRL